MKLKLKTKIFWKIHYCFLSAFVITGITGCSYNQSGKSVGKVYELLFSAGDLAYDPVQAEKLPYASIAMAAGGGAKILMLPVQVNGQQLSWIASNRVVLVTEKGRLVKTAGLTDNLNDTRFTGAADQDWIGEPLETLQGKTVVREVDFLERQRVGVPIRCALEVVGAEAIQIHQRQHQTVKVLETCQAGAGLNWSFVNQFWIDASEPSMVWKSVQNFAPTLPRLTLEQIKRYQP